MYLCLYLCQWISVLRRWGGCICSNLVAQKPNFRLCICVNEFLCCTGGAVFVPIWCRPNNRTACGVTSLLDPLFATSRGGIGKTEKYWELGAIASGCVGWKLSSGDCTLKETNLQNTKSGSTNLNQNHKFWAQHKYLGLIKQTWSHCIPQAGLTQMFSSQSCHRRMWKNMKRGGWAMAYG